MDGKFCIRCYFSCNQIKCNHYNFKILILGENRKKLYKYIGKLSINNKREHKQQIIKKIELITKKVLENIDISMLYKIYFFTDNRDYLKENINMNFKGFEYELLYLNYCEDVINIKKKNKKKQKDKKPKLIELFKYNNYKIVFIDMEINFVKKEKGNYESIAIGAVMCDKYGNTIKKYYSLIRPSVLTELNEFCIDIAKIDYHMLSKARGFKEVIESFDNWCGNNNVVFSSWGINDIKVIKKDCLSKGINKKIYNRIRYNYVNFQDEFMKRIIKSKNNISLLNGLKYYNLHFEGKQHNPTDDAYNLSRIYKHYINNY